jgi:hypothetical protein
MNDLPMHPIPECLRLFQNQQGRSGYRELR